MSEELKKQLDTIAMFQYYIRQLEIAKMYKLKTDFRLDKIMEMLEKYDFLLDPSYHD